MFNRLLNNSKVIRWVLVVVFTIVGVYYYATINKVPFHPDESTYIYMSNDIYQTFSDPRSVQYTDRAPDDIKQHYRLVDPALLRYVIGAGLAITGKTPLPVDWNWSLNWQENINQGALPDERELMISRIAVSFFFLLGLLLIYKTGTYLQNSLTGLLAVIMLGVNALILLHTRRAMPEAILFPALCFTLWSFIHINRFSWLSGLAVLIAVNAKLSAAPLILMGMIAIFILDRDHFISVRKRCINFLVFISFILIGTYILNPVLWADPLRVFQLAFNERAELVNAQIQTLQQLNPAYALTSLDKRVASLIAHLFFSYPAALDTGNYLENLKPSIDMYFSIPGTTLMRGLLGGLICFILAVFGFFLMIVRTIQKKGTAIMFQILFLLGCIMQFSAMSITIPLPFQRYVIPLLPFTCLISAYGLGQVLLPEKKAPG
ncbi:MAG: hypothetical protein JW704_01765 [Anaerolineaceae bacterium]|nr:hypothetical protein [Anaerolineaceae bacterium]MBN2678181.1 hypothetical protein [Anaerolineaceae bacterium]